MEDDRLKEMLYQVRLGAISVEEALEYLRVLPYEQVGHYALLDHHRTIRRGFPEVVLGQGKTPDQVVNIVKRLSERSDRVLVTRVSVEMGEKVSSEVPGMQYLELPKLLVLDHRKDEVKKPGVLVATAGTADVPVAEEAAVTAELMGNQVERLFDVGVAGLHRLLDRLPQVQKARVIVVVAGMDGALPSVVGGLVAVPVIAVPTSVGYGASFHGVAALLTMLNSCSNGVAVVNIDNGFGGGYLAGLINLQE